MKYIGYIRVSTKGQEKSGLGLQAQKAIIEHYASIDNAEIIQVITESESGKDIENRPKLKEAIELCTKNNYTLIVAKLDRLSRDVEHIFKIKKLLGDRFKSCDLPSTDSLTLSIFSGIAQRERELISIRTKQALQAKKRQGVKLGKPENFNNTGRDKGVKTIKDKAQKNENTIRAKSLAIVHRKQGMSFNKIANLLNENGFRSSKNGLFYSQSVKRLINYEI